MTTKCQVKIKKKPCIFTGKNLLRKTVTVMLCQLNSLVLISSLLQYNRLFSFAIVIRLLICCMLFCYCYCFIVIIKSNVTCKVI